MSKRIKEIIVRYDDKQSFIYGNTLGEVIGELVRCKECKNWQTDWNPEEGVDNFHFCPMVDRSVFDDWYCADGERRTDG